MYILHIAQCSALLFVQVAIIIVYINIHYVKINIRISLKYFKQRTKILSGFAKHKIHSSFVKINTQIFQCIIFSAVIISAGMVS